MKNRSKFIISIVLLILIILPVVVFFYSKGKQIKTDLTTPLQIPLIPDEISDQNPKYNLNITDADFNFPEKLPALISENAKLDENEITEIAEILGFSDPKIKDDYFDGVTYVFSTDQSFLIGRAEVGKLEYSLNEIPKAGNLSKSEDELINIAKIFLEESKFTGTENVNLSSISYYSLGDISTLKPSTKENALIIQINFTSNISDISILSINPQNTLTFVQVLTDGTIFKAHAQKLKTIEKTEKKYALKNFDEFQNSIERSVIVLLKNGLINPSDVSRNTIDNITIDSIEISYLQTRSQDKTLQPIYLLKGTSSIANEKGPVDIVLYLLAISVNN